MKRTEAKVTTGWDGISHNLQMVGLPGIPAVLRDIGPSCHEIWTAD